MTVVKYIAYTKFLVPQSYFLLKYSFHSSDLSTESCT